MLSSPVPPSRLSLPMPPSSVSLSAPPLSVSLPSPPTSLSLPTSSLSSLSPVLPVSVLASALPVPSMFGRSRQDQILDIRAQRVGGGGASHRVGAAGGANAEFSRDVEPCCRRHRYRCRPRRPCCHCRRRRSSESLPTPPFSESLPPRPSMVSLPLKPRRVSATVEPVMLSAPTKRRRGSRRDRSSSRNLLRRRDGHGEAADVVDRGDIDGDDLVQRAADQIEAGVLEPGAEEFIEVGGVDFELVVLVGLNCRVPGSKILDIERREVDAGNCAWSCRELGHDLLPSRSSQPPRAAIFLFAARLWRKSGCNAGAANRKQTFPECYTSIISASSRG